MATDSALTPVNSSLSLAHLAEHTNRYVEAGLRGAPSRAKAYVGNLKRFGAWCSEHGLEPLAGFVTHLAETGKKTATVQRHYAAVSKAHALRGVDSPTVAKKFKVLLEGIARLKGIRQKQAPAFSLALFRRTVKAINVSWPMALPSRWSVREMPS